MKKTIIIALFSILFMATAACGGTALKTDKEKYSYAIGYRIAQNIQHDGIDLDMNAFAAAVKDVIGEKDIRMTEEEMREALQQMSIALQQQYEEKAQAELEAGKTFLEENKKKDGVQVTSSGLQYRVLREGNGKKPASTDVVTVHYKGRLINGEEFDSSYKRDEPATFPLDGVIPGWSEGLQLMKPGAKYELILPPDLAYGSRGNQAIPGNSVLIFEVELLEIADK